MAMSSWTKLNPTVNFFQTNKLFYNKFLYKVKIYCPGARLLDSKNVETLKQRLSIRLNMPDVSYNYGGSWWLTEQRKNLKTHASLDQLIEIFTIKHSCKDIKIRIEEPYVSLYSNDEQQLLDITNTNWVDRINEVHRPTNDVAISFLMNGEIIVNKKEKYAYKVFVKRMFFDDIPLKHSLLDHLYNYESEVRLPQSLIQNLNSHRSFFPGGYFYINDLKIATFIGIMCPEFVYKIFKLTKLD